MKRNWFIPVLFAVAVAAPVSTAHARPADYDALLVPSPDKVRPGQTITVAGDFCATPSTVTFVGVQTLPKDYPKGLPPYLALDLTGINLQQTGTGMSFQYTPDTEYRVLHFTATCSDGAHALDTKAVMVFPPVGQFWWSDRGGEIRTQQGVQLTFAMSTMDCDLSQPAHATIGFKSGTPWFDANGSFSADGVVYWDIDIPIDLTPGHYIGTIACAKPGGGTYTGTHEVLVANANGIIPATGSGTSMPLLAILVLALGTALVVTSRARYHRTS